MLIKFLRKIAREEALKVQAEKEATAETVTFVMNLELPEINKELLRTSLENCLKGYHKHVRS